MGWPWSSSTPAPPSPDDQSSTPSTPSPQPPPKRDFSLTDEQRGRIFGPLGGNTPSSTTPTPTPTQQAQADKDLEAFLTSLSASDPTTTTTTTSTDPPTHTPDPDPSSVSSRLRPDGTLDISPPLLQPRTMRCRDAFDAAFYCQSLGGKFNDIYRFGALQSCSEQWGAFWFCMRTRTWGAEERGRAVAEFYQERDERRRRDWGGSEAVWGVRGSAVRGAFGRDPDEVGEGGGVE